MDASSVPSAGSAGLIFYTFELSYAQRNSRMQLTAEQEADVQKIMAEMDCPDGFPCYESKFEKLIPVKLYRGANVIQCQEAKRLNCGKAFVFCNDIVFCKCPLRNYAAFHLGR